MTSFLKSATVATAVAAGTLAAGPARAASAAPDPVRIGFGEACANRAGTVAFVLENTDRRRHTVSISGHGLTPAVDRGPVPATRTVVVQFDIGAGGTTVSVAIDGGTVRTQRLKGCPRGDGDQGMIPQRSGRSGGKKSGKPGGTKHTAHPKQSRDHGMPPKVAPHSGRPVPAPGPGSKPPVNTA